MFLNSKKWRVVLIVCGNHIIDIGGMDKYGVYSSVFYFYIISRK